MTDKNHQQKMLALAFQLSSEFHCDQFDNGGNPYILHPVNVMMNLNSKDPELQQIAMLHDVVEDCVKKVLVKYFSVKDPNNYPDNVESVMALSNELRVDVVLNIFKEWGFSDRVRSALKLMTKMSTDVGEEGYFAYIQRMFNNIDAIRVKMADIQHNTNILRLKNLTEKTFKRNQKYCVAFHMLEKRLKELCGSLS